MTSKLRVVGSFCRAASYSGLHYQFTDEVEHTHLMMMLSSRSPYDAICVTQLIILVRRAGVLFPRICCLTKLGSCCKLQLPSSKASQDRLVQIYLINFVLLLYKKMRAMQLNKGYRIIFCLKFHVVSYRTFRLLSPD